MGKRVVTAKDILIDLAMWERSVLEIYKEGIINSDDSKITCFLNGIVASQSNMICKINSGLSNISQLYK